MARKKQVKKMPDGGRIKNNWLDSYGDGGNIWSPNQPASVPNTPVQGISVGTTTPQEQHIYPDSQANRDYTNQQIAEEDKKNPENSISKKIRTYKTEDYLPQSPYSPAFNKVVNTVGDMLAYPVQAVSNQLDPSHAYRSNPYNNMTDYGMDASVMEGMIEGAGKSLGKAVSSNWLKDYGTNVAEDIKPSVNTTEQLPSTNTNSLQILKTPKVEYQLPGQVTPEIRQNYKDILKARDYFTPDKALNFAYNEKDIFGLPVKATPEFNPNKLYELIDYSTGELHTPPTPWTSPEVRLKQNLKDLAFKPEEIDNAYKKAIDESNTVVRGVSTNWDAIKRSSPEGFNNITKTLEDAGIDWKNNPDQAATYMATHIPGQTGYGRAGLSGDEHGLYTSNSEGTASGYTYGDGYIVKAKRPTTFEGTNRQKWLEDNKFNPEKPLRQPGPFDPTRIQPIKDVDKDLMYRFGDKNRGVYDNNPQTEYNYGDHETIKPLAESYYKASDKMREGLLKQFSDEYEDSHGWKPDLSNYSELRERALAPLVTWQDNVLNNYIKPKIEKSLPDMHAADIAKYKAKNEALQKAYEDDLHYNKTQATPGIVKMVGSNYQDYAHYVFKGDPGTKVLEPIEVKRITPSNWENTSRAHEGQYTPGLTKRANGGLIKGWLDNYKSK